MSNKPVLTPGNVLVQVISPENGGAATNGVYYRSRFVEFSVDKTAGVGTIVNSFYVNTSFPFSNIYTKTIGFVFEGMCSLSSDSYSVVCIGSGRPDFGAPGVHDRVFLEMDADANTKLYNISANSRPFGTPAKINGDYYINFENLGVFKFSGNETERNFGEMVFNRTQAQGYILQEDGSIAIYSYYSGSYYEFSDGIINNTHTPVVTNLTPSLLSYLVNPNELISMVSGTNFLLYRRPAPHSQWTSSPFGPAFSEIWGVTFEVRSMTIFAISKTSLFYMDLARPTGWILLHSFQSNEMPRSIVTVPSRRPSPTPSPTSTSTGTQTPTPSISFSATPTATVTSSPSSTGTGTGSASTTSTYRPDFGALIPEADLSFSTIIGSVLGVLLAFCVVYGYLWFQKRKRRKNPLISDFGGNGFSTVAMPVDDISVSYTVGNRVRDRVALAGKGRV